MSSTRHRPDAEKVAYLTNARWFQQKGSKITSIELVDFAPAGDCRIGIYNISFEGIEPELYLIPTNGDGSRFVSVDDASLMKVLFGMLSSGGDMPAQKGLFRFEKFGEWVCGGERMAYEELSASTSNSLLICRMGGRPSYIMKLVRRLQEGENIEAEVNRHIFSKKNFRGAPAFLASGHYEDGRGKKFHIASAFDYVVNKGSAWDDALLRLGAFLEDGIGSSPDFPDAFVESKARGYAEGIYDMGATLASLHLALASDGDPAFGIKKIEDRDIKAWRAGWLAQKKRAFGFMRLSSVDLPELAEVLSRERDIDAFFMKSSEDFLRLGVKIRQHGDFHLGQVLVGEGCFYIIDFEGEPLKKYGERAICYPALKDVAGMMRSFNYAAFSAYFSAAKKHPKLKSLERIRHACRLWESMTRKSFLDGYYTTFDATGTDFLPLDEPGVLGSVLRTLMMDKALYEVEYEINNRPDWLPIPLGGILEALKENR